MISAVNSLFLAACGTETTPLPVYESVSSGQITSAQTTSAKTAFTVTPQTATTTSITPATTLSSATPNLTGVSALIENITMDGTSGKKDGQLVYSFIGQFPSQLNPYSGGQVVGGTLVRLPYKFDPEAARKLLEEAGWKVGADGSRLKAGKKLSFTLSSTTSPVRVSTAEVIISYWKNVGIEANFRGYTSSVLFDSWDNDGILARGKFDMAMYAQVGDIDPGLSYVGYHSSQIPTDANKGSGGNNAQINNKQLDQVLDAQRATANQGKRIELFKQFQKILYDNVYEAPLFSRVNNYVVSNKVINFKANPTSDTNWWNSVELWLA